MKNNRFFLWLLTISLVLCSIPMGTQAAKESGNVTLPTVTAPKSYGYDVMATMGQDPGTLIFTWTTNGDENERVEIAEVSKMANGKFPSEFLTFTARDITSVVSSATATGLKTNTEYCYRLANGSNTYSELYYTTTHEENNEFSFLLAGDVQIGATDDHIDTKNWGITLDLAREWFGNDIEFLLSAGDQTNYASAEAQYEGYATPEWLRSLPLLTVVGNHDDGNSALYSEHFVYEDVDYRTTSSAGEYGGDYWVAYDGALIMAINLNNLSFSIHKDFMENAIAEYTERYGDPNWKIVTFHQSLFSAAGGRWEDSYRRDHLAPILSELDVDAVLMGHDHIYTRAYMMNGTTPITDTSRYTKVGNDEYGSIVDPADGEVFYMTANSSTGSKYYDMASGRIPYVAYANQEETPNITKIDVTSDSMTFTTYRTSPKNELGDVVDFFAIQKTPDKDVHAPTLTVPEVTYYASNQLNDVLEGVTAFDNVDGDITDKIKVSGKVDPCAESIVTYTVTDKAGNTATVERRFIPYNLQTPVKADNEWKYLDDGTLPFVDNEDIAWTTNDYDDSAWETAVGPFGARNGELDEHDGFVPNTLLGQFFPEDSEDAGANISTFFFKTTFDLEDPQNVAMITADFYYDDAAEIYINGVLVEGFNNALVVDKSDYCANSTPSDAMNGSFKIRDKTTINTFGLKEKGNVLAVQLYQSSVYSDDIFFHFNKLDMGTLPKALPFKDVAKTAWYYESVATSFNRGLFVGTTDTTFSPNATMTRASVWTVLARISGADISTEPGQKWYEGAQKWAMDNKVSDGTNPNNPITREQFALMLYNMKGTPETDYCLNGFADEARVSSWAIDGMNWAVSEGLLLGRNGTHLAPKDNASRAESCTLLLRYIDVE